MKTLKIQTQSSQSIVFLGESLANLKQYIPAHKTIIITDTNISKIYQNQFPDCPVIKIGTGEAIKTLSTVEEICIQLSEWNIDRSGFIVAIGGGLVCDLAGFAASIYLRGIRFGFVSTSLLSQVDASIGGKNGANLLGYKNRIGTWNQPDFVICDTELLQSLPKEEFISGLGEVVKHAIIADRDYFSFLSLNHTKILNLDKEILEEMVWRSLEIKAEIVSRDEKEMGERRKLNFGHTFGHAVEKVCAIAHGKAVSIGMILACQLAIQKGIFSLVELEKIQNLLTDFGLPTTIQADKKKLQDAIQKDKKREQNSIYFVLPKQIGNAIIEPIDFTELNNAVDKFIVTERSFS
ncbi:MAG: 3-dehydroquinate synthase [Candidatus Brocadiae bacterium]|nr:3-dehydroquinate synthase [Candidatus Brocadiia bacterium]